MMTKEDVIHYCQFCFGRRRKWNWYGTLYFRNDVPLWIADRCFWAWINEIEAADVDEDESPYDYLPYIQVREPASHGHHICFHIFVRGLRDVTKWPWIIRWKEELKFGDADIWYFVGSMAAISYMRKTLRPDSDFELKDEW